MSAAASCHEEDANRSKGTPERQAELRVVLVGRPNSGKSSLYNVVTGGDAHVGNYPGITVDILEGSVTMPDGRRATVADVPGFYSVEATVDAGTDEGVARAFLERLREARERHPFVVVQVLDATRLALGLRLTRELAAAKLPLVVALTHADVLEAEGRAVDVPSLAEALAVPVVLVCARDRGARDVVLAAVEERTRGGAAAGARAQDDERADARFEPRELAARVVKDVGSEAERTRRRVTERVDAVLLHPVVGPILFVALMTALFAAVFVVADPATQLIDRVLGLARAAVTGLLGKNLFTSFLVDGLLGGAGTVVAFMPQIVILTVALELLEASGYLARGAFLVDRLLRLLGLSGRSFLPLLMGHACAVPAIQATRIVRDPRERLTTILVLPLMTCSARLPTYSLIILTFFVGRSAFFKAGLFVSLYFAGILTALVASWVLRRTATKGRGLPLVLEMPAYRLPQARVVARKAWQTSRRFLRDVGTTILVCSALLWVLVTVPAPGARAAGPADQPIDASVAAWIGRKVEPVTEPAGFDWRIDVGLIASFGQRELMVSTVGVIFGVDDASDDPAPLTQRLREAKRPDGAPLYSTATGLALLAFFLLACQCMSTVAAIRRETGGLKWPAFVVAYTYALGYGAAVLVFQLASALG
jgi:ferrous iron transport protein B